MIKFSGLSKKSIIVIKYICYVLKVTEIFYSGI